MESEWIVEVLGGPRGPAKAVKKPGDFAELFHKGLCANSLPTLAERIDLASTVPSRRIGIPQHGWTRSPRSDPCRMGRAVEACVARTRETSSFRGRHRLNSACACLGRYDLTQFLVFAMGSVLVRTMAKAYDFVKFKLLPSWRERSIDKHSDEMKLLRQT